MASLPCWQCNIPASPARQALKEFFFSFSFFSAWRDLNKLMFFAVPRPPSSRSWATQYSVRGAHVFFGPNASCLNEFLCLLSTGQILQIKDSDADSVFVIWFGSASSLLHFAVYNVISLVGSVEGCRQGCHIPEKCYTYFRTREYI